MDTEHDVVGKPRTEDLAVFLSLSIPIFAVTAALLSFIVIAAVTKAH